MAGRSNEWFHRLSQEERDAYRKKYPGTSFHRPPKLIHPNPDAGIGKIPASSKRVTVTTSSFGNIMNTINIVDYRIKSNTLAKVIVAYTGNVDAEYISSELGKKLGHLATVVKSSFKQVREGVAVGFIRANKAVRVLEGSPEQVSAKYRVMSSNILMDNTDKTLWDMKIGASGKYLTRRGTEDLAELVSASVQRRPGVPRVDQICIAKAATKELVAFVDDQGDVDHGFAIATSDNQVKVLSFSRRIPVTVDYDTVVSIHPVSVPKNIHAQVTASLTADQKKQSRDYYTRLYSYNPEYLRMVIDQINATTVA